MHLCLKFFMTTNNFIKYSKYFKIRYYILFQITLTKKFRTEPSLKPNSKDSKATYGLSESSSSECFAEDILSSLKRIELSCEKS